MDRLLTALVYPSEAKVQHHGIVAARDNTTAERWLVVHVEDTSWHRVMQLEVRGDGRREDREDDHEGEHSDKDSEARKAGGSEVGQTRRQV